MKDGDYVAELHTALVVDPKRDEAAAAAADGSGDEEDDGSSSNEKAPTWARLLNKATTVRAGMELLADSAPQIYYLHA